MERYDHLHVKGTKYIEETLTNTIMTIMYTFCHLFFQVIPVNMSAPKICSENLLSSLRGTIQAQNFMYVKCQAKRGTEVAEAYGMCSFIILCIFSIT